MTHQGAFAMGPQVNPRAAALLVLLAAGCTAQRTDSTPPAPQRPPGTPPAAQTPAAQDTTTPTGGRGGGTPQPRPFNRVITSEARTFAGLFRAHRVGERL